MRYVVALVLVVLVVIAVVGGIRWSGAIPDPTFTADASSSVTLAGSRSPLPWPTIGSAAVAVGGVGVIGTYGADNPQPIASIAKVMTAAVILADHPLSPGQSGPNITFDAADVATYDTDLAQSQSVAKVIAGESLSELQMLEAMLIPSANNIAVKLAQWDAGSVSAFVAKMNAKAKSLGMTSTHYTDPSGLLDTTVSTPTDLIKLAGYAMKNPVFASIVAMPQVTLPEAGTVYNYDYDLGRDGIVGIKTGSDAAAGGCFLFDANEKAAGKTVQVVGVVFGQQTVSPITAALNVAKLLAPSTAKVLHYIQAVPSGMTVGRITTPWNSQTTVTTKGSLSVFGYPGEKFSVTLERSGKLTPDVKAGQVIGDLVLHGNGTTETTPVTAVGTLKGPSNTWRIER